MFDLEKDMSKIEESVTVWLVERHNDLIEFLSIIKNEEFNDKLVKQFLVDFSKYFSLTITEKALFVKKLKNAKREYMQTKANYLKQAIDEGNIKKSDAKNTKESYILANTDIKKYEDKIDDYENIVLFFEDSISMLRNVPIQEIESVYRLEKKL